MAVEKTVKIDIGIWKESLYIELEEDTEEGLSFFQLLKNYDDFEVSENGLYADYLYGAFFDGGPDWSDLTDLKERIKNIAKENKYRLF